MLHVFEVLFWLLMRLWTVSACLCVVVCVCVCVFVCFAVCTEHQSTNLHRTTTQQTCFQYDSTIMYEIFIAGGHAASNAPDLLRPPKLSGAGPRLVLGWGTAREDLRVLPAYFHLPLLCLSACVASLCGNDLYILCYMF